MKVIIDQNSGFCKGVIRAIDGAEQALAAAIDNVPQAVVADVPQATATVYSLGAIVHNNLELQRLERQGLKTIIYGDLEGLPRGAKVLIRAHGEPPKTYEKLHKIGAEILDFSCPVVLKLQRDIKAASERGSAIIIFGKKGHAEVLGLEGQIAPETPAVVLEHTLPEVDQNECCDAHHPGAQTAQISFSKPLGENQPIEVFSQTTKSPDEYDHLTEQLLDIYKDREVKIHKTICAQVSSRRAKLEAFAAENDVIIFVAGAESSNGKVLYNLCKNINLRTYKVEAVSELQKEWFEGAETVGIAGATSTPHWLLQQFADALSD